MDQLASAAAAPEAATAIDCRSLEVTSIAIPSSLTIGVVHSGQHRALADGRYAERLAECRAAEATLGSLRDATIEDAENLADAVQRRRARHVITENGRVLDMMAAIRGGDLASIGHLLDESHASLAHQFEVSTPELDQLCDVVRRVPGVLGARLTGAGFGGCVIVIGETGWRLPDDLGTQSWMVHSVGGPTVAHADE